MRGSIGAVLFKVAFFDAMSKARMKNLNLAPEVIKKSPRQKESRVSFNRCAGTRPVVASSSKSPLPT
jgi:hypothetical protein